MRLTETREFRLDGTYDEIAAMLTRLMDAGIDFEFAMTGWPSVGGHIEARASLLIEPADDTQAAMIRLMFPM